MLHTLPFTLPALGAAFRAGTRPAAVIEEAYRRIAAADDPALFLHLRPLEAVLAEAERLGPIPGGPLWGVPFVVKDNIDVAGCPTTAACPAYAYEPQADAFVVAQLRAAGALVLGKTNLDQFATGLVGVRSPYGVPRNALDPALVPGGSSAGSAVAVGLGLAAFSLGTDTAGSGRVPAALNGIVGLKPSLGALSAQGVVPACRSLDTVSIFAQSVEDAYTAFAVAARFDPADAYARPFAPAALTAPATGLRIGVPTPATREFFGDHAQAAMYEAALEQLTAAGMEIVELDFTPFYDVARMLYEGAWVAERYTVVEDLMRSRPEALHPTTAQIIGAAEQLSAADAFRGLYRLKDLSRATDRALAQVDLLCVPTIPTFYSRADLEADPVTPNSNLGTYTNFVNLLDLCALAVPCAARADGRPGSVTLLGRAGQDGPVASLARLFEGVAAEPVAPADMLELAVCGAHMSGLPLNGELTGRGGRLVGPVQSAPDYRLYALPGGPPHRPGMLRGKGGAAIEMELWQLPRAAMGDFLAGIPAPLSIGQVRLEEGRTVLGFLLEAAGATGAEDITHLGGWRAYLEAAAALEP